MAFQEPLGLIADLVADWVSQDPSKPRWEIVTAIFGWSAGGALLGWLLTSIVGFPDVAGYFFGAFWLLFGIAFRRDIVAMRWRKRMKDG